jgi:hypothetical protein
MAGDSNWSWNEISPLAATLAVEGSEPIICGGQAVGYWAARYGREALVSRDLDAIGDREDARRIAALLGGVVRLPHHYEMTVLAAVVSGTWRGRDVTIELLNSVPGIETDPEEISVREFLSPGLGFRVLHPVALLSAKLHAVRFFSQEGRNDLPHLRTVLELAEAWLGETVATDPEWALLLIHRWYRFARVAGNRKVLLENGIDWRTAVPLMTLARVAGGNAEIRRFLELHWPRISAG